jgi:F-type H+-transporting ATPase subunit gamma
MPSLKAIKKRIGSVKNTRQITKAMKMVSAAKLRRAQENVVAARPYAKKVEEVLQRLARQQDADGHPLVVLVTSDRGLCGGFNANISKATDRFVKEKKGEFSEVSVMCVGRKGYEYLKSRQKIHKTYTGILSSPNYQTAANLAHEVIEGYTAEEYDAVYLIYNAFRSVMSQDITIQQLLPINPPKAANEAVDEYVPEYIYEPSKGALLGELLPKYVEVTMFKSMLESVASEHGARMTAMDSASKNASEMIGKLTLQYNRARQAAITKELMEIISGAESIKG